ncbi:unnamed protein product [Polarella glacialis]|uniref:Uncharacterized protein n=1 Tax=Polarella glacialis TaxID=89957 RepID=A0A813LF64_POLGL|nr:unnamed protein product [Polarella glacialis]
MSWGFWVLVRQLKKLYAPGLLPVQLREVSRTRRLRGLWETPLVRSGSVEPEVSNGHLLQRRVPLLFRPNNGGLLHNEYPYLLHFRCLDPESLSPTPAPVLPLPVPQLQRRLNLDDDIYNTIIAFATTPYTSLGWELNPRYNKPWVRFYFRQIPRDFISFGRSISVQVHSHQYRVILHQTVLTNGYNHPWSGRAITLRVRSGLQVREPLPRAQEQYLAPGPFFRITYPYLPLFRIFIRVYKFAQRGFGILMGLSSEAQVAAAEVSQTRGEHLGLDWGVRWSHKPSLGQVVPPRPCSLEVDNIGFGRGRDDRKKVRLGGSSSEDTTGVTYAGFRSSAAHENLQLPTRMYPREFKDRIVHRTAMKFREEKLKVGEVLQSMEKHIGVGKQKTLGYCLQCVARATEDLLRGKQEEGTTVGGRSEDVGFAGASKGRIMDRAGPMGACQLTALVTDIAGCRSAFSQYLRGAMHKLDPAAMDSGGGSRGSAPSWGKLAVNLMVVDLSHAACGMGRRCTPRGRGGCALNRVQREMVSTLSRQGDSMRRLSDLSLSCGARLPDLQCRVAKIQADLHDLDVVPYAWSRLGQMRNLTTLQHSGISSGLPGIAERVGLPEKVTPFDPRGFLNAEEKEAYEEPDLLLSTEGDCEEETEVPFKISSSFKPWELLKLFQRWDSIHRLALFPAEDCFEKDRAGVFVVPKGPDEDRQIIDGRLRNRRERRRLRGSRSMAHACLLCQLPLEKKVGLLSLEDLEHYYHKFTVSKQRSRSNPIGRPAKALHFAGFKALPPGAAPDALLQPCWDGLPMGDHLAVDFAQSAHIRVLQSTEGMKEDGALRYDRLTPVSRDGVYEGIIIDDRLGLELMSPEEAAIRLAGGKGPVDELFDRAHDLLLAAALGPCSICCLRAEPLKNIFCVDASSSGAGACSTEVPLAVSDELWRRCDKRGYRSRLLRAGAAAFRDAGWELPSALEDGSSDEEDGPPPLSFDRARAEIFDIVELYGRDHEVSKACGRAGLHVGPVIELRLGVDLESLTVFSWLRSMIRAKRIRILLWEPPCTTFSPARFPKLRSKQASFGFRYIDFDTCVGNLHRIMACFLASAQSFLGRWHVGEHPWPGTMKYTAAWLYLQLLGARVIVFDWCRFGRAWKKATALIGNADCLDELGLRCECPRSFKHLKFEGSLTTKASSYSPEFASAFAELARANLHQLCAGCPSPVCPEDPIVSRKARHVSHLWAVQFAETLPWTANMIYKFGDGGHINLKEARAYKRLPRDSKPVIGQDFKVCIGAFNKGRSPSAALSKIVVSTMPHILGKNLRPCSFHQPTWGMRADAPSRLRAVEAPTAAIPQWFWQLSNGTHPSDVRGLDENSYTSRGLGRWFQYGAFALGLVRARRDEPQAKESSRERFGVTVAGGSERDHSPEQGEALRQKFLARDLAETVNVDAPNYMTESGATGPASVSFLDLEVGPDGARHQYVQIEHKDEVCFLTSCLHNLPSSVTILPCSTPIYKARFKTLLEVIKLPKGYGDPSSLRPGRASFFVVLWEENGQKWAPVFFAREWRSLKMLRSLKDNQALDQCHQSFGLDTLKPSRLPCRRPALFSVLVDRVQPSQQKPSCETTSSPATRSQRRPTTLEAHCGLHRVSLENLAHPPARDFCVEWGAQAPYFHSFDFANFLDFGTGKFDVAARSCFAKLPLLLVIAPLERNIKPDEFISFNGGGLHGAFEIPNYRRAPFWKYFWVQHFVARQHVFNVHHTGYIVLCVFFWWTGAFSTAPIERREKYYMHSPKFRLQTAYANPGTRPAAKIAQEGAKVRYFYRGHDHPFTLNELKDYYFKLRENWLIQHYPGIQYPFVYRQMVPEKTDEPLKVPVSDPLRPGQGGH